MSIKNKVQLVGNVGKDLDVKSSSSGKKIVRFSLATNETYKNEAGEKTTNTDWHRLVCFGKTADIVEKYVSKGSQIAIEGKLSNGSYEDKEGIKRYTTDIIVNEILLLDSKKE